MLPEMMVGLTPYPQQLGQGMHTRVLSTHLWECIHSSGVNMVIGANDVWPIVGRHPPCLWARSHIKKELCNTEQVC